GQIDVELVGELQVKVDVGAHRVAAGVRDVRRAEADEALGAGAGAGGVGHELPGGGVAGADLIGLVAGLAPRRQGGGVHRADLQVLDHVDVEQRLGVLQRAGVEVGRRGRPHRGVDRVLHIVVDTVDAVAEVGVDLKAVDIPAHAADGGQVGD